MDKWSMLKDQLKEKDNFDDGKVSVSHILSIMDEMENGSDSEIENWFYNSDFDAM